jgi:predicted dehydrogenase
MRRGGAVRQLTDGRRYKSEPGNYPALYTNLHEAIASMNPDRLAVKPEETIEVLRLIELGGQSSREGKVLDVPRA